MTTSMATALSETGTVYVPRCFRWDPSIPARDREGIIDHVCRLPVWVDHQLGTDNLDVKKLGGGSGLWRLRVGAYRAVFQILTPNVVLHRVFRRREDTDYDAILAIPLVRSGDGLRTLVEDVEEPPPVPPSQKVCGSARDTPDCPEPALSAFSDRELAEAGLGEDVVDELRRIPAELVPDRVLARLGVLEQLVALVAEMWERPDEYVGKKLSAELVTLEEREAAARLVSRTTPRRSLVPLGDPRAFLALLDGEIEDWMVYLHPSQLGAVRRPLRGASRVRGAAGTGKTVVALHRARHLAERDGWRDPSDDVREQPAEGLGAAPCVFPRAVRGQIRCRTVNQVAMRALHARAAGRDADR